MYNKTYPTSAILHKAFPIQNRFSSIESRRQRQSKTEKTEMNVAKYASIHSLCHTDFERYINNNYLNNIHG